MNLERDRMSAQIDQPKRHLVTAQEYLRMGETGVFAPDARAVHVFQDPTASGYRTSFIAAGGDELAAVALPSLRLRVAEVFPS